MRLLLDKHLPTALAVALRRRGVDAVVPIEVHDRLDHHAPDDVLLAFARDEGRVLVTYDIRTIPNLATQWAAEGRHHAGVVLVSQHTIRSDDVGSLLRALLAVVAQGGDWSDRMDFLRPVRG